MNNLNSVLLEGIVSKEIPVISNGTIRFSIISRRFIKMNDGSFRKEESEYFIIDEGGVRTSYEENFRNGRGLRIVGRLARRGECTVIIAEHIEWKPILAKEEE